MYPTYILGNLHFLFIFIVPKEYIFLYFPRKIQKIFPAVFFFFCGKFIFETNLAHNH